MNNNYLEYKMKLFGISKYLEGNFSMKRNDSCAFGESKANRDLRMLRLRLFILGGKMAGPAAQKWLRLTNKNPPKRGGYVSVIHRCRKGSMYYCFSGMSFLYLLGVYT